VPTGLPAKVHPYTYNAEAYPLLIVNPIPSNSRGDHYLRSLPGTIVQGCSSQNQHEKVPRPHFLGKNAQAFHPGLTCRTTRRGKMEICPPYDLNKARIVYRPRALERRQRLRGGGVLLLRANEGGRVTPRDHGETSRIHSTRRRLVLGAIVGCAWAGVGYLSS